MSEPVFPPCPSHIEMAATGACQRCGSFTCIRCRQLNPLFCPKCVERRAPFLFNRDNLHVVDLLSATWNNVFRQYWLELSLAALLLFVVPAVASYALQLPVFFLSLGGTKAAGLLASLISLLAVLGGIVQFALQMSFQRGITEMAHAAWNGQKLAFNVLFNFKAGLKAGAAALLVAIPLFVLIGLAAVLVAGAVAMQSSLFITLAVLLAVVAAIALAIWLLPAQLLFQPFVENPDIGIVEAIRLCFERGRGYRLKIFLVGLVSLPIFMAGFLVCGIGLFPAMGLMVAYQTGLWKALSTPGASGGMPI
jgi:hypothetical protein